MSTTPNEPSTGATVPPVVPLAAQAIHFCRTCGAAWEPQWDQCPHCVARLQPPTIEKEYREDRRFVMLSVQLYFALLAVSIVSLLVVIASRSALSVMGEFIEEGIMALIVLVWCIRARAELKPIVRTSARPRWFALAILGAGVTFVIAHFTVEGINRIFDLEKLEYLDNFRVEHYSFAWAVIAICVQPGVFEELGFRGVILTSLQKVLGSNEALVVSALLFAILHLSIPSIPHLFLMGLALGWLRIRTGSLYPGMLMHFTHNFLVILSEYHGHGGGLPW